MGDSLNNANHPAMNKLYSVIAHIERCYPLQHNAINMPTPCAVVPCENETMVPGKCAMCYEVELSKMIGVELAEEIHEFIRYRKTTLQNAVDTIARRTYN